MGTTAEKGARVLQSIAEVQEGINNLGGSLTNQTPFKDFKAQLDNIYDNLPKTEYQEGTEVNLGVTIKGKLDYENGVVGIGQTEQDTTTGKNKFAITVSLPITQNGITLSRDDNNNIILNGTPTISSGSISFQVASNVIVNAGTYTMSIDNKISGIGVTYSDTTPAGALNLTLADTVNKRTATISAVNYGNFAINVRYDVGKLTNFIVNPQLELGSSATDYEQYSGGYSSPSPNWEQEINSVTGNQDVVVSGKNLLDIENCSLTSNGGTLTVNNGLFTISGTFTGGTTFVLENYVNFNNINKNNGDEITLSIKNFVNNGSSSLSYNRFWLDNSSNQYYLQPDNSTGVVSKTLNIELNRCRVYVPAGTYNTTFNVQIELGSTATTYEPYITPKSYQLSLGDIELNAIGDYKDELIYDVDEDKVYKNAKIGKVVFNGSETGWERNTTTLGYRYRINVSDIKPNPDNIVIADILSNYFIATSPDKLFNTDNYTISCFSGTAHTIIIACISNETDTLEKWKTWLSTHNTEVRYVLATATLTEITDTTLINQVKALYNAHSNNGTTIITSNGNLPMIIKVRGLKGE